MEFFGIIPGISPMLPRVPDNQFEIRNDVPILDEHVLRDKEGNVIFEFTAAKLEQIARNNNRRIAETGDEVPLIPGHTKDHQAEDDQPEIVGYADNFRVGWLWKTNRKAIFARLKYFKDKAKDVLRRYPRRSVELWLKKMEIDPIALLGATTPERSLGLVRMNHQGDIKYSREFYEGSMDNQGSDIVSQVLAALEQTQEWQFLKHLASQAGPAGGQGGEGGMSGGPQQFFSYEGEADADAEGYDADADAMGYAGGYEGQKVRSGLTRMHPTVSGPSPMKPNYEGAMDEGEHYAGFHDDTGGSAQPRSPGGQTHTMGERQALPSRQSRHIMGHGNMISHVPHRSVPSGMHGRLQRDDLRIRLARLERENDLNRQIANDAILRLRRAERMADIIQLEAEGVMLDRAEELEEGMVRDDQNWSNYVEHVRRRYHRDPTSNTLGQVLQFSREGNANRERTNDEKNQIVDYATKHNLSYSDALDKFHGQRTE